MRARACLGGITIALVLGAVAPPSGATSCAPPGIAWERGGEPGLAPHRVRSGERITVYGYGWRESLTSLGVGCASTGGDGDGGCADGPPIQNITLQARGPITERLRNLYRREAITGGKRSAFLGRVDADVKGRFTFTFEVPQLPPGEYWIALGPYGQPAVMEIVGRAA